MVVTSTTEAEFLAISAATKTTACMRHLGQELEILTSEPTPLLSDNRGAVLITTNDASIQRTRHMGAHLGAFIGLAIDLPL